MSSPDGSATAPTPATLPGTATAGSVADAGQPEQVFFGLERVSPAEKTRRVSDVFAAVARKYDVMNDIMSAGLHRPMKQLAIDLAGVRRGDAVLDLAGGTGDLTARFAERVGPEGTVVLADLNADMIQEGRRRLDDRGLTGVRYVQVNAESLPFPDTHFDVVSIAFGLRNVARKDVALREMRRVLKPGGRVLVLEFSQARSKLVRSGYRVWQSLWPGIGKAITGDAGPYSYLVDSIATHPDQETLAAMLADAGFERVRCHDLMNGIVALHLGFAPAATGESAGPSA